MIGAPARVAAFLFRKKLAPADSAAFAAYFREPFPTMAADWHRRGCLFFDSPAAEQAVMRNNRIDGRRDRPCR